MTREHVQKIDLDRIASVQARLPACDACGERYGKHSCHYDRYERDWVHSWVCLGCGFALEPAVIFVYEIALADAQKGHIVTVK